MVYLWCPVLFVVNLCDFGLILVGYVPRLCPMDNKFMEEFYMNRFRDDKKYHICFEEISDFSILLVCKTGYGAFSDIC